MQISLALIAFVVVSCSTSNTGLPDGFIEKNIEFAVAQQKLQVKQIEESGKIQNPRTTEGKKVRYVNPDDWTSGFFPGSMWYMYDLTDDTQWMDYAKKYTEALHSAQYLSSHHDIGFIIQCSYGNGLRLSGNSAYEEVIVQAAKSLSTRFRPVAGIIQSWNVSGGWQAERGWECPVIIDNMMNLELLFNATRLSGDSSFYKIAVSHADKTLENHHRPDGSSFHVIDYSLSDGSVRHKHTAQGFAHESAWSRGQAWGIYGYAMCYRETGDPRYLEQAQKTFDFIINHPNFPADNVPYWDLDAPNIPDEPRDASSAAIIASALLELANFENGEYYKTWAEKIIQSLASPTYRAELGENGNFILKHSVGSIPHGAEIDKPLNYADYYFVEALMRYKTMISK